MKKVSELKKGDIVKVDGVEFVVQAAVNLNNGKTFLMFEDVPATHENMAAYGKLLKIMKEQKENDNEREEIHGSAED